MSRRSTTRPEIRVGGFRLSSIAPQGWAELRHTTRPTGVWEVSWSIPKTWRWRHPALVRGALVELMHGPICIGTCTLDEPDWDAGKFVALGSCRDGETAVSITAAGETTTKPNTAIDAAIARGVVSWTRLDDFGTTAVGELDSGGGLVTLQSVLDAWAQENESGWAVDNQRHLIIRELDETTVDWLVVPGSGVLGSAAEERVDRVFVRYISSTNGKRATASYPSTTPVGGVEKPVDITDRGKMTSTKATSIAKGIWSDLQGHSGWTNGLTVKGGQVTTLGGIVADLALVKAGDTMRLIGVPDPRGTAHNLDVVIGDTEYDWAEDELQLNPVGLAARDDAAVLEQVGNLAVDAMAKAGGGAVMPGLDIQSGTVTVSGTAVATGGTATVNVTFPDEYATAPAVFAVGAGFASGGAYLGVRACDNVTATGFRLVVVNYGTAAATWTNFPFRWVAIGGIA